MSAIDINCDLGESYGQFITGNDQAIFPYISSCNIACGFHGGDPFHMEKTIKTALQHNVQIGAHPSYPDLAGFGRRKMAIAAEELKAIIKYQISALKGMTESLGGKVTYVKAHGALYNSIAHNEQEAVVFLNAVKEIDEDLAILGLAGSPFQEWAEENGFNFTREGFLDRKYQENGSLMPRKEKGAVLTTIEESLDQLKSIALKKEVQTSSGKVIPMEVDSLCIHGDNPLAEDILKLINSSTEDLIIKRFAV